MKKLISFLVFGIINTISFAQNVAPQEDSISAAKIISRTEYVFEGKLIKSVCYVISLDGKTIFTKETYNDEYGKMLTSNTIQITKVFKGNIKEGTIEIITEGGALGNTYVQIHDGIGLGNGGIGIFFCKSSEFLSAGFSVDNKIPLQISSRGISYSSTIPMYRLGLTYNTLPELYSFMQRQPNIIIKDTSIHPIIQEYFNTEKNK